MRPLLERFPSLRVPFSPLATLPTPVILLEKLSGDVGAELWVKRDDLTHPAMGGNKMRKFEFFPPLVAPDGRALLAYGPHGSNWLIRLAYMASQRGLPISIYSFPQTVNPHALHNMACPSPCPWEKAPHRLSYYLSMAKQIPKLLLRQTRLVPVGGSNAATTLGYVNAALELADDLEQKRCLAPEAIFVALGTGGTAAGLALGLALAGLPIPVIAVRITEPLYANYHRILRLARGAAHLLGIPLPPLLVEIEPNFYGGYACPIPSSLVAYERFLAREGLELDHTYTAKAAAALLARVRLGRRFLLWQTFAAIDVSHPSML